MAGLAYRKSVLLDSLVVTIKQVEEGFRLEGFRLEIIRQVEQEYRLLIIKHGRRHSPSD
jgi:hypothetical protein